MTARDLEVNYFSNGTEGEIWMSNWCKRCAHDHVTHSPDPDYENGCQHIAMMISHIRDEVFVESDDGLSWTCSEFTPCPCERLS